MDVEKAGGEAFRVDRPGHDAAGGRCGRCLDADVRGADRRQHSSSPRAQGRATRADEPEREVGKTT